MEQLITTAELTKLLGLSRTTIFELRKAGDFIEPVGLSKNRIAWRLAEVTTWLASR
ncbi:helix-turn-helix transcriptional regulator [Sphingomonas sp. LK11]|jgi:predicted DNA-binding transcriptional regulator AlpA|uniref:helix-turn-helix transcriptional regulator n=1 Tax=Sphingomonas sp. LK11 TaxID=1390395 RepID=UPI0009F8FB32|nr:AlpA family phage regulatory protein [Sphingomonas sp. LK11]